MFEKNTSFEVPGNLVISSLSAAYDETYVLLVKERNME